MEKSRTFRFDAVTDVWTGDANRKGERLIPTGLLGSIRWWYEVLVRGLGGAACDPHKTQCQGKKHCAVCELFGCTGWARKFRFQVLDKNDQIKTGPIKAGDEFTFRFIPLRPIRDEEWALLEATLRLIVDYGSIGGKTSLIPGGAGYKDYGIIHYAMDRKQCSFSRRQLETYIVHSDTRKEKCDNCNWASLKNFWFLKGIFLTKKDLKKIIDQDNKKCSKLGEWLLGKKNFSKRLFSFTNDPRTFGFINPELFSADQIQKYVNTNSKQYNCNFIKYDTIINLLFQKVEATV